MIARFPAHSPPKGVQSSWYSYLDAPAWSGGDPSKPVFEEIHGTRVEKKMGAAETGLANALNRALDAYLVANAHGQSYVAMEIELPTVGYRRKPDVCYISHTTWPQGQAIPPDAWWSVTPDLAIEAVSPYELAHATIAKVQEYFAAGVQAVWLILPNVQQVYCYTSPTSVRIFTRADELTGEPVLPGFRMQLARLFPELVPEDAPTT